MTSKDFLETCFRCQLVPSSELLKVIWQCSIPTSNGCSPSVFPLLACRCWAQLGPSVTLYYRGLAHFHSELISSPSCLTLAIWANHTVTGLSHMGPSLCWALVTWAIPNSGAQAPTTALRKIPRTAIVHGIIVIREFTTATNVGATYLEALICHIVVTLMI